MCVLALAWRAHPQWHLVLAGNRDELHERPTSRLARWDGMAEIVAGRDLVAGGTWLGLSEHGRLGVVTNLRGFGGPDPAKASRGALIADYLSGDEPDVEAAEYNPFNLILADRQEAFFLSNKPHNIRSRLSPGIYGLSNGMLDEPWPKTLQIKAGMLEWIVGGDWAPETLFELLHRDTLPATGVLPDEPSEIALEPRQSPIFIRHPLYATRCSTLVLIDHQGRGRIIERRFDSDGIESGSNEIAFIWPML